MAEPSPAINLGTTRSSIALAIIATLSSALEHLIRAGSCATLESDEANFEATG